MSWRLHHLLELDPEDFEGLVANLWSRMGFKDVQPTGRGPDGGIDARATSPGIPRTRVAIQAKRYGPANKVNVHQVREYASLLLEQDIDKVVIVTTSSFTTPASEEARKRGIDLVNGKEFLDLLVEYGPFDDVVPIEQLRHSLVSRAAGSSSVFVGHLRDLRGMQHLPQWAVRFLLHSGVLLGAMILIGILGRLPLLAFAALPFFLVGLVVGLLNTLYGRAPESGDSLHAMGKESAREGARPGSEAPSRNLRFGLASLGLSIFLFALGVGLRSFPAIILALPFWLIAVYLYSPASRGVRPGRP